MVQQEGADIRGFWGGKAFFLARDHLKTGQNAPLLFTDKLTGVIYKSMILIYLLAEEG
jgi:hypothetical protein